MATNALNPDTMTPTERGEAAVELLARALIRLHQRGQIHAYGRAGEAVRDVHDIGLELVGDLPLSVPNDRHGG